MGRRFAGVLGLVAFLTIVARGVAAGADAEATLKTACICLFVFAAIGFLVGVIAEQTVEKSVTTQFDKHVNQEQDETSADN